jgi:hypothetical protein
MSARAVHARGTALIPNIRTAGPSWAPGRRKRVNAERFRTVTSGEQRSLRLTFG